MTLAWSEIQHFINLNLNFVEGLSKFTDLWYLTAYIYWVPEKNEFQHYIEIWRSLIFNCTHDDSAFHHTVCMDCNRKILKFARNYWGNGFYEDAFPLLHTKHPLENGYHIVWMDYNLQNLKFARNDANQPLGRRIPHNLHGLWPTKSKIGTKTLR